MQRRLSEITNQLIAAREPETGHRAGFALSAAIVAHGDPMRGELQDWAQRQIDLHANDAADFILKTDVAASHLGDLGTDPTGLDYIRLEAQTSIFSQIALARPYPLGTRLLTSDEPIEAVLLADGEPIPLSGKWEQTNMVTRKVGALTVITKEFADVLKATPSLSLAAEFASANAVAKDEEFIAEIAGAAAVTETSGGSTMAQIDVNLSSMLTKSRTARFRRDQTRWTMGETTFDYLSGLRGSGGAPAYPGLHESPPTLRSLPVSVSAGAGGFILLLDASRIIAWPGTLALDTSSNGSIEMEDGPANNSVTPTAAALVSMFQVNSLALRAVSYFAFIESPTAAIAMTVSY